MYEFQDHYDVIIVGAGLSGIGAACMLRQHCPDKSFLIVEKRDRMGGTWDLFRYPGVRSDSDMHTLGYSFKPWREAEAIADGPAILRYIREAAAEYDIETRICYSAEVRAADWSGETASWQVRVSTPKGVQTLRCNWLSMCAGYYSYDAPFDPGFEGIDNFSGRVVHPQFWPEGLDYSGQQVVVIGSGATAVTLVPALAARGARHVVMLQRSPGYVISAARRDRIGNVLSAVLPSKLAYRLTRWKNVMLHQYLYRATRVVPNLVKRYLLTAAQRQLGPGIPIEPDFVPAYNPWDQRLCLVPDGDFFEVLRRGDASIVTDEIERITPGGIALKSGRELPADMIVTATGFELEVMGKVELSVDGAPIDIADTFTYKGSMFSGIPNLVMTYGYINESWTLRADLTAGFMCRVLQHLDACGLRVCTPRLRTTDTDMPRRPFIDDFTPSYLKRRGHLLAKQGDRAPWLNPQSYRADRKMSLQEPIDDGVLQFS